MKKFAIATASLLAILALSVSAAEPAGKSKGSAKLARGKYLVEQVAMCVDCHSPRGPTGEYVREKWLQGAPLAFKNTVPMPRWSEVAPPLAGLPGWTEAQVVTLLTTGKDQKGGTPEPPMPEYRMTTEDAAAVAAYLASLGPVAKN